MQTFLVEHVIPTRNVTNLVRIHMRQMLISISKFVESQIQMWMLLWQPETRSNVPVALCLINEQNQKCITLHYLYLWMTKDQLHWKDWFVIATEAEHFPVNSEVANKHLKRLSNVKCAENIREV